jgi:hypothetical protein
MARIPSWSWCGAAVGLLVLAQAAGAPVRAGEKGRAEFPYHDDEGDHTSEEAFQAAVRMHQQAERPWAQDDLLYLTWFGDGDPNITHCRALTTRGRLHTYRDCYDWAPYGAKARADLTPYEFGKLKELLPKLPESAKGVPRALLLLISFRENNEWQTRVYDRSAPPREVLDLDGLTGGGLVHGPRARGEMDPREEPSPELGKTVWLGGRKTPVRSTADWLQTQLQRPVVVDPELRPQDAGDISLDTGHAPLRDVLALLTRHLDAEVFFYEGVYWISRRSPPEILPEPLQLPALTDETRRAARQAIEDLSHKDYDRREAASRRLVEAGPGALALIGEFGDRPDVRSVPEFPERQKRLEDLDEQLRRVLRRGRPTVRLQILLSLPADVNPHELTLGDALRGIVQRMHGPARVEVDQELDEVPVSFPDARWFTTRMLLEWTARLNGARLEIEGHTIRFLKPAGEARGK